MKLVTGNSNRALADAVAAYLEIPLTAATVKTFADKEVFVEIHDNVRGEDVFILQSTSYPANDNLMELLIIADALRRSSARRITAVIPYFGYARQDRRSTGRTPISAKLVANLITEAGVNRVLTIDLHAAQIQGFFDIPTDNLYAAPIITRDIRRTTSSTTPSSCRPTWAGGARPRRGAAHRRRPRHRRQAAAQGRRLGSDEHHRRGRRPFLPDRRRHRHPAARWSTRPMPCSRPAPGGLGLHHPASSRGAAAHRREQAQGLVVTDSIAETDGVRDAANIRRITIAPLIGEAIATPPASRAFPASSTEVDVRHRRARLTSGAGTPGAIAFSIVMARFMRATTGRLVGCAWVARTRRAMTEERVKLAA